MSKAHDIGRATGEKTRGLLTLLLLKIKSGLLAPVRLYRHVQLAIEDVRAGRRTPWDVAKSGLATLGGLALVVVLLFPVYWIFAVSLAEGGRLFSADTTRIFPAPTEFTLDAYRWVLFESDFFFEDGEWGTPALVIGASGLLPIGITFHGGEPGALFNSLYIVSVTITAGFLMVVPGAYALSRRKMMGRKKILYGYILFTQVGAGLSIATLIALFAVFNSFGLTNNLFILGLFYAAGAVPFNTWLLKTYMDNIPVSYEEAARVDGASTLQTMREIILPLSKPGLAVILIFLWIAGWNEFIIAQTLLRPENYPLSVELYQLADDGRFATPWTQFAAFASLFALPVALLYFFSQQYVESGLSFGGMEG